MARLAAQQLLQDVKTSQTEAVRVLLLLLNQTETAEATLVAQSAIVNATYTATRQNLLDTAAVSIAAIYATRDEFVLRTVPRLQADLQVLNYSVAIAQLQAQDQNHFVANATNGLGTTFANGWIPYNPSNENNYYLPRFWMDRSVVYIRGTVSAGSSNQAAVFLPKDYRPLGRTYVFASDSNGAFAEVKVRPDGSVTPIGSSNWLSLDTVSFRIA